MSQSGPKSESVISTASRFRTTWIQRIAHLALTYVDQEPNMDADRNNRNSKKRPENRGNSVGTRFGEP